MQINSLYQWNAMKLAGSPGLKIARRLLFMPDLFNYWLSGVARAERTIASTSQFYDPQRREFAGDLLKRLGLDASLLDEIVDPGSKLGPLLPEIAERAGWARFPCTRPAVTTLHRQSRRFPAEDRQDWAYISSGTWSLMGVELDAPVINAQSLAENFTNEAGRRARFVPEKYRGMWLLEECRRDWGLEGHRFNYEEVMASAAEAPARIAKIDPDAFLEPGHMPARICDACKPAASAFPANPGEVTRVILESLAERYRQVAASLEIAHRADHSRDSHRRRRIAESSVEPARGGCDRAHGDRGPSECTAAGTILIQAMGAGELSGLAQVREVVRASFQVERFEPAR
jgi:rhamnulokinase